MASRPQYHRNAGPETWKRPERNAGSWDLVGRTKFTSTKRWARVRLTFLRANPLCADCLADGRTTAALDVHHIRKRADDPDREQWYDIDNLLALCKRCHTRRTNRGE